jgi:hypothetical protein
MELEFQKSTLLQSPSSSVIFSETEKYEIWHVRIFLLLENSSRENTTVREYEEGVLMPLGKCRYVHLDFGKSANQTYLSQFGHLDSTSRKKKRWLITLWCLFWLFEHFAEETREVESRDKIIILRGDLVN